MRLTGTRAECARFVAELTAATAAGVIREVSHWYPNRATSTLGRVYLDLAIPGPLHDADDLDDLGEDVGRHVTPPAIPACAPARRAARRRGRGWSR